MITDPNPLSAPPTPPAPKPVWWQGPGIHPESRTAALALLATAGRTVKLLTTEEARKLRALDAEWLKLREELARHGTDSIRRNFLAAMKAGEPRPADELEKVAALQRQRIKEQLKEIAQQAVPLVRDAMRRLGTLAEEIVAKRTPIETAEAEKFGLPLFPSPALVAATYFARRGKDWGAYVTSGMKPSSLLPWELTDEA